MTLLWSPAVVQTSKWSPKVQNWIREKWRLFKSISIHIFMTKGINNKLLFSAPYTDCYSISTASLLSACIIMRVHAVPGVGGIYITNMVIRVSHLAVLVSIPWWHGVTWKIAPLALCQMMWLKAVTNGARESIWLLIRLPSTYSLPKNSHWKCIRRYGRT